MYDACERNHCEWGNSPTRSCFWDKSRCPHLQERLEEIKRKEMAKAKAKEQREAMSIAK